MPAASFCERRWKPDEALEVLAGDLERLLTQAMSKLVTEERQQQLIDQFASSMPSFVREKLELHPQQSLEATIVRTRELMLLDKRRGEQPGRSGVHVVERGEVAVDPYTAQLEERVRQLELQLKDSSSRKESQTAVRDHLGWRPRVCFGCGESGHIKRDCPKSKGLPSQQQQRQQQQYPRQSGPFFVLEVWPFTAELWCICDRSAHDIAPSR